MKNQAAFLWLQQEARIQHFNNSSEDKKREFQGLCIACQAGYAKTLAKCRSFEFLQALKVVQYYALLQIDTIGK
jgi:hypothetical protein